MSASNVEKATISFKKDVRITTDVVKVYTEAEVQACSLEARRNGEICEACQ